MAGDWIPIQCSLPDSPKVARIASLVKIDADAVVGKLVRMWRWFGEHTTNGVTHIGAEFIDDRVVLCIGFVAACAHPEVRYAIIDGAKLTLPEWTKWNGSAAKTRLKDNRRRAKNRAKDVSDLSRSKRDMCPENVPAKAGPQNRTEQYSTVQERRDIQNRTEAGLSGSGATLGSAAGLDCSALDSERARRDERAKAIARIADGALDRAFLREIASSGFPLDSLSECMKIVHATPNLRKPGALLRSLLEERGFVSVRRNGRHE